MADKHPNSNARLVHGVVDIDSSADTMSEIQTVHDFELKVLSIIPDVEHEFLRSKISAAMKNLPQERIMEAIVSGLVFDKSYPKVIVIFPH